ncbi:MAG: PD-(D/E)XK nuclease family protein [Deltaproteobacteria bacterium]|nr:PD-(D/E)XK nuclease family protein [Deltaproteobacteria bacterium]
MSGEPGRPVGLVAEARVRWLDDLPAAGVLPERTVIVASEAIAHAWRREIVDARPELLMGTRFVTPIGAAISLLELQGVHFTTGEEAVRAARIVAYLQRDVRMEAFDLSVLREGRGWADALASTLTELEGAALDVTALEAASDSRCRDLARLLKDLDAAAGASWTIARVLREATARLVAEPAVWPFAGACLVEVSGHEDMVMANWLRAIPRTRIVAIETQPRRTAYVERVRARFGELALQQIETVTTSELGLLAAYLFSAPDVLTALDRPRSLGNDGTVQLEEHAGVEEEMEAAVSWVIGEVGDCGAPLEQIGIVVPKLDPYAALLSARLEVLLPDSVCVLGGVPATSTSAGARIAMLLRALAGYLHLDVLAELLPVVDLGAGDVFLSRSDAISALYELGTVGGSIAHPAGALDWVARIGPRCEALAAAIAEAPPDEDLGRELRAMQRKLEHLRAITAPLEAIDRVARVVLADAPLNKVWPTLKTVLQGHLRIGVDGVRIVAAIDEVLQPLTTADLVFGEAALAAITNALVSVRLPVGRFGEARVTIAALGDVAGLTFRTVRVLGLAEGAIPSNVREDPVLPDSARRGLGAAMPLAADRTVAQLHSLHRTVLGATERIVLSVARMDPQRRYREPSGALLEAAAALGRPPLGSGGVTIPDASMLRQQAFEPARHELRTIRARWPVNATGLLDRAVRRRQVPKRWTTDRILSLDRLLAPPARAPGPMDGWLVGELPTLPGLTPERPVSASALSRLLECPHRFLYERVLGWSAPPALGDEGAIDAMSYGTLFHATAEGFYRDHGTAFCAREKSLDEWKTIAGEHADRSFATFIETYPLAGTAIRDAARRRLRRDLAALLETDCEKEQTFVDVERAFGPTALTLGARTVHVHGFIDRIDRTATTTIVRDLKTGKAKRRKDADDIRPAYDVQLGLYGLVARANAAAWGVPERVEGAYVYPADSSRDERSFRDDFETLTTHTRSWLATALDLLEARRFPRTPDPSDCTFCPFKPVCGVAAQDRALEILTEPEPAVAGFAALKIESEDGDDA